MKKTSKKIKMLITLLFISTSIFAHEVKKEEETVKTKMDLFSSKTGTITKFVDTNLPNLKTAYSGAETKIRKIINGVNTAYFFQITNKGKYGSSTASIEYSDLIDLLKALQTEVEKDIASNPNYLENKFVTVDGF